MISCIFVLASYIVTQSCKIRKIIMSNTTSSPPWAPTPQKSSLNINYTDLRKNLYIKLLQLGTDYSIILFCNFSCKITDYFIQYFDAKSSEVYRTLPSKILNNIYDSKTETVS